MGFSKGLLKVCDFAGGEVSDFKGPVYTEVGKGYVSRREFWTTVLSCLDDYHVVLFSCVRERTLRRSCFNSLGFFEKTTHVNYKLDLASVRAHDLTLVPAYATRHMTAVRKMEASGRLTFKRYEPALTFEFNAALRLLIQWKIDRIRDTGATNFFRKLPLENFYRSISLRSNSKWSADLSSISIDGKLAALHLGFIMGDCYYYVLPAFDLTVRKLSPGSLLLANLIRWASNSGLTLFDFTIGSEEYKKRWATDSSGVFFYEHSNNVIGSLALSIRRFKYHAT